MSETQIEIVNNYLRRIDETRVHEVHPAVRAFRDWYDNTWHGGKQPCEVELDTMYGEAVGSQRYADIVPVLFTLPSERDGVPITYEVYDSESNEPELTSLLRDFDGGFTFTPKWRGKYLEIYGPKEYHEGFTRPSRTVVQLDCPEPDTRPIDPFERFTEAVRERPPVTLRGGALAFASFFGGILTAVSEEDDKPSPNSILAIGPNGLTSITEMAEADDSEYSVLTVREEVNPDTGKTTGRLALHCELGGVVDMTGGWYLMVYPA